MKKNLLCLFASMLTVSSFSQQKNPVSTLTKQDYLQKSKNQKTTAWVLLGGGVLVGGIGVASAAGNVCIGCPEKPKDQSGWVIAGGTLMVSSIPFFIASAKNKKKAISMSLKNQLVPVLKGDGFANRLVPSLIVKINL
jgi:hypothetical protein